VIMAILGYRSANMAVIYARISIQSTEPRRSGTIRLAILEPWHLPDTTEYDEIEY